MKTQHEKLQVLNPCLDACKQLLMQGAILEYRRLDETDKDHQIGSPDVEVRFIKDCTLWILMFECKRPDGGVHLNSQKNYRDKYITAYNTAYYIVRSKEELMNHIESHTRFFKNKLDGIEFYND